MWSNIASYLSLQDYKVTEDFESSPIAKTKEKEDVIIDRNELLSDGESIP